MEDKLHNTAIRAKVGMMTVESLIRRRRLQWLGHAIRMDSSHLPHQLLVCQPEEGGKCQLGSQKLRWNDVMTQDLKK